MIRVIKPIYPFRLQRHAAPQLELITTVSNQAFRKGHMRQYLVRDRCLLENGLMHGPWPESMFVITTLCMLHYWWLYMSVCSAALSVCNCASIAPKAILLVVSLLDFAIWLIIMPGLMLNNMPDRLVALVSEVC